MRYCAQNIVILFGKTKITNLHQIRWLILLQNKVQYEFVQIIVIYINDIFTHYFTLYNHNLFKLHNRLIITKLISRTRLIKDEIDNHDNKARYIFFE